VSFVSVGIVDKIFLNVLFFISDFTKPVMGLVRIYMILLKQLHWHDL
jgi:hypothetical protein